MECKKLLHSHHLFYVRWVQGDSRRPHLQAAARMQQCRHVPQAWHSLVRPLLKPFNNACTLISIYIRQCSRWLASRLRTASCAQRQEGSGTGGKAGEFFRHRAVAVVSGITSLAHQSAYIGCAVNQRGSSGKNKKPRPTFQAMCRRAWGSSWAVHSIDVVHSHDRRVLSAKSSPAAHGSAPKTPGCPLALRRPRGLPDEHGDLYNEVAGVGHAAGPGRGGRQPP